MPKAGVKTKKTNSLAMHALLKSAGFLSMSSAMNLVSHLEISWNLM